MLSIFVLDLHPNYSMDFQLFAKIELDIYIPPVSISQAKIYNRASFYVQKIIGFSSNQHDGPVQKKILFNEVWEPEMANLWGFFCPQIPQKPCKNRKTKLDLFFFPLLEVAKK